MPNEILMCLISAISSLIGAGIGAYSSSKLTNYRLEQLEKKMDALSSTEQRLGLVEQKINMMHNVSRETI